MKHSRIAWLALVSFVPFSAARADLLSNLVAYYNFEETGDDGLRNLVGEGATHNGIHGNGASFGSGSGFAGNGEFPGADATSSTDRSTLLVGKALNIAKDDTGPGAGSGWFTVPTLNAGTLGTDFSVSVWFHLAPDSDNTEGGETTLRDFVFESGPGGAAVNFDVSFGTSDANGSVFNSFVGANNSNIVPGGGNLATGTWHHVVHTFASNGTTTTLTVYLNGALQGTAGAPTASMDFTFLNFGANRDNHRIFDGMLDEVAVWDRTLTGVEARELHERGMASLAIDADPASVGKAFIGVRSSDHTMGYAFGTGMYDIGDAVFVDGFANPGHVFAGWSDPFANEGESFSFTATGSIDVVANFQQDTDDDDGDGLTNYEELVLYHTDPGNADTDGDGIDDFSEVRITMTDPLTSQLAVVNYILENLPPGSPGGTVLARNEADNTLTLLLKPAVSTMLEEWSPLVPATSGVSAGASGGRFQLQVPASEDPRRFFRVEGNEP